MTPTIPEDDMSAEIGIGRDNGALGPSDTSDSGSDVPPAYRNHDSDSQGTGDRASVAPLDFEESGESPLDRVVEEEEAGIAHTPPDPERNGG